jgi:hypothetical protein
MYYSYEKLATANQYGFKRMEGSVSLFGCNVGLIPNHLRRTTQPCKGELGPWSIEVPRMIQQQPKVGAAALMMHLNPNDKEKVLLYEIRRIWGYSHDDWTPIMLESVPLLDDLWTDVSIEQFSMPSKEYEDLPRIYSFLYLQGTVKDGKVIGKWTAPRPSATNTPVLYPHVLSYFMSEIGYVKAAVAELSK